MYTGTGDVLNVLRIKVDFVSKIWQGFKYVLTNYLHSEHQLDLNLLSYKIHHDQKKKEEWQA